MNAWRETIRNAVLTLHREAIRLEGRADLLRRFGAKGTAMQRQSERDRVLERLDRIRYRYFFRKAM